MFQFRLQLEKKWLTQFFNIGLDRGGPGVPLTTPLLQALFNQTTFKRWRKCHYDILAIVKKPFFLLFFLIKVLMRSSTPLQLAIPAAFY